MWIRRAGDWVSVWKIDRRNWIYFVNSEEGHYFELIAREGILTSNKEARAPLVVPKYR